MGREGNRLTVAIPTYWGMEQRLSLTEELAAKGVQADLRMALQNEIEAALMSGGQDHSSDITSIQEEPTYEREEEEEE